jgi:phosphatidylserine/phosphatidylglycerophosphate/cardiolipin synthase-like enzyme
VKHRGLWELSTEQLADLFLALAHLGTAPCTQTKLQAAGFDGPAFEMLRDMPANHAHALVASLLGERTYNPRPRLELVWSGPEAAQARSRDTSQVLRELFAAAEHDVIVAGFAFWGASSIFEPLHQRALDRGLAIEFFIHLDPSGKNAQMTPDNFYRYTWPWNDVRPTVYYDARADGDAEQGSMHAKCVVVDESATFITSANFTSAAQDTNVELGVVIRDHDFATRTAAQWRSLAANALFVELARR